MRAMKRGKRQLRSLGRRGKLLLLITAVALPAVVLLVAFDQARFTPIPLALLLAAAIGQLILFERRVLSALRRAERNLAKTEERVDVDRIEFMQQRILASVETGRLEMTERLDKIA
jgi:hypothetical protein